MLKFSEMCGFSPKQWQATEAADTHVYTLFGGSRGPGKSYWLRWYALRRLLRWGAQGIAGAGFGLFCETYRELIDRQVSKIAVEWPAWMGCVKDTHTAGFGFYLRPEYGGGILQFRNLDDPTKYQSAEFAGLAVDELTKTPQRTFTILRASMRWPGVSDSPFVAATNPNGRWADWVREMWIEHTFPPELQSRAGEFAYIPALPGDNPHLSQSYWDELDSLPELWRRAWRDGDWYAIAEGIVYSEFTDANVTDDEPDPALPFEVGFDDGYIDPRVLLLIQRTSTGVLVFDEVYESKVLDVESLRRLLEKCAALYKATLPDNWPALSLVEASAWCLSNGVKLPEIAIGSSEAVQLMRRFKESNIPARGGTHVVVEGIKVMRGLVCDGQGVRVLKINKRCMNLIKEMTTGYRYPEGAKRDNEKPADGNDHACDALRYWVWMRARR